ncbi:MAG: SGNH/GDSL hydrolase family protein [Planctomycetaceae bacterium]|nr:SGNH/GDSL hydrolase family protein [Planctomycetaceae bacterium]MCA9031982.1 SGNH/GDSL hydrolase family protein [Planctomycetaceae bacterium]MCA9044256.1 SGNH/GDSL hydrolase family protein [Planctomycetaceae bacterium]MCB9950213.1 SGNH/GDSL hydrolase family protein [Planctomycetaceae bacterium]
MKLLLHLSVVLSAIGLLPPIHAQQPATTPTIRIVAFGDSTTATRGELKIYCHQLRDRFAESGEAVEIINAGVGGNHTELAKQRFERDVLQQAPDVVIIQFGINDSAVDVWRNPPATGPRVSLEQYEQNLAGFVEQLKSRDVHVILMTPNPLQWTDKLKQLYRKPPYDANNPDGFNVLLTKYAAAVRRIAKEQSVPLIDVDVAFREYGQEPDQSMNDLLLDGMHPNERGHRLITELLLPELSSQVKSLQRSRGN